MAPSTSNAPSLLLLPAPPFPLDPRSLNAAYRAPLTAVLKRLSNTSNDSARNHVLVIAIACPILAGPSPRSKSLNWKAAQSLLAGTYTLISAICTELSINTSGEPSTGSNTGLDPRVVLIDHQRQRTYHRNYDGEYEANCTPVLDLAAFASTVYPWKTVFHPSAESGYELLNAFLDYSQGKQTFLQAQLVAVEGGITMSVGSETSSTTQSDFIKGHDTVCLGGTFDHLHPGHKLLLHATALLMKIPEPSSGKQGVLIVGISGDELLTNKKYAEVLQPWAVRANNVLQFLSTIFNSASSSNTNSLPPTSSPSQDELHATFRNGAVLVRCVNIHDPFGPTITEEVMDVIVVSGETRSGGQAINDKRTERGWKPLGVFEIDVLDPQDISEESNGAQSNGFASKISSTEIRQRIAQARNGSQ
ncbi:hypothetical protein HDV63DRAFT_405821 [Trichoderma sp. SZMC 28014]